MGGVSTAVGTPGVARPRAILLAMALGRRSNRNPSGVFLRCDRFASEKAGQVFDARVRRLL
eukprot:1689054-Lingulodinium_polyedra.AAC.1